MAQANSPTVSKCYSRPKDGAGKWEKYAGPGGERPDLGEHFRERALEPGVRPDDALRPLLQIHHVIDIRPGTALERALVDLVGDRAPAATGHLAGLAFFGGTIPGECTLTRFVDPVSGSSTSIV
jgi:hypothetical protein